MQIVQVGQTAPDITVQTVDGQAVQLASAWSDGRHTLLIFLRHLG